MDSRKRYSGKVGQVTFAIDGVVTRTYTIEADSCGDLIVDDHDGMAWTDDGWREEPPRTMDKLAAFWLALDRARADVRDHLAEGE